ncbi:uncharacterized protein EDC19_0736 [Natranaerovirga hydrolytica]|uniref:DUF177 domain-containing protein n=1 Tax=Natranaerovirga hydrolytica TaxID=680378 RepID=A0A4R1MYK8_9FIRM|nr:DUF177 domain-containing protein [Natranaerovirga hydrolytica]TCK98316.1 uncharacterized protein EDC19_0736 [Natranaerovirga hydrolytica]
MIINITDLLMSDEDIKEVNSYLDMKSIVIEDIEYFFEDKIKINIKLYNLDDAEIEIIGHINAKIKMPCSRCTEYFIKDLDFHFNRTAHLNDIDAIEQEPITDERDIFIDEFNIDINQLICDEIIINFPMKVLCKEDCKGICNNCGCNLNNEKCNCESLDIDPRMAVFQDILKKF